MTNQKCLYCGGPLGFRVFTGVQFCCNAHARADEDRIRAMMLDRLHVSAAQFRSALYGDKFLRPLRKAS